MFLETRHALSGVYAGVIPSEADHMTSKHKDKFRSTCVHVCANKDFRLVGQSEECSLVLKHVGSKGSFSGISETT